MNAAVAATIFYGVVAIVGGLIGYLKTQSTASVISGSISGVILILAGVATLLGLPWGLFLAVTITALLVIFFAARYSRTRKFMPAGLMSGLGAICLAIIIAHLRS